MAAWPSADTSQSMNACLRLPDVRMLRRVDQDDAVGIEQLAVASTTMRRSPAVLECKPVPRSERNVRVHRRRGVERWPHSRNGSRTTCPCLRRVDAGVLEEAHLGCVRAALSPRDTNGASPARHCAMRQRRPCRPPPSPGRTSARSKTKSLYITSRRPHPSLRRTNCPRPRDRARTQTSASPRRETRAPGPSKRDDLDAMPVSS